MKTCRRVKITEPLPEKEEAQLQTVISAVELAINRKQLGTNAYASSLPL